MEIQTLQSRVNAADIPLEQLAGNKTVSDQQKVTQACRQFEAVLLRQILQEARKTVITSSTTGDSMTSGIYNDMVNNQLADKISRSGEFGLAKSLQTQLVRQVLPDSDAASAKATPGAAQTTKTKKL